MTPSDSDSDSGGSDRQRRTPSPGPRDIAGVGEEALSDELVRRPTTSDNAINVGTQQGYVGDDVHVYDTETPSTLGRTCTLGSPGSQRPTGRALHAVSLLCQEFDILNISHTRDGDRSFDPMCQEAELGEARREPEGVAQTHCRLERQGPNVEAAHEQNTYPATQETNVDLDSHDGSPQNDLAQQVPDDEEQRHADPSRTSAMDEFITAISMPTTAEPPSPTPLATITRGNKRTGEATSLRRSRRLAGARGPTLQRAQSVLMRKLGIMAESEQVSNEATEAYVKLFEHPLSRPQLTALAALFGWAIPPECEARSAELLS